MSQSVTFLGNPVPIYGELPKVGEDAPNFALVGKDLNEINLHEYKGKRIVLNIFPSLDTDVCAASVRRFNVDASKLENTVVLCVSMDLPFAAQKFCVANGIDNVAPASGFRSDFGQNYGVEITEGPMRGLYARCLIIIDENGKIMGTSLVPEITHEPDYDFALNLLK